MQGVCVEELLRVGAVSLPGHVGLRGRLEQLGGGVLLALPSSLTLLSPPGSLCSLWPPERLLLLLLPLLLLQLLLWETPAAQQLAGGGA